MLIEKYREKIEHLRAKGVRDEWYLSKIIDPIVAGASASESFEAMNAIIQMMLNEDESDVFYEHAQMALSLARAAQTTELPEALSSSYQELIVRARELGDAESATLMQLLEWFRIKT